MEETVTILLWNYNLIKSRADKVSEILELDEKKDRYVKIQSGSNLHFTIKNSVDGDEALTSELHRLQMENEFLQHEVERLTKTLLKCQIVEHTKKKWSWF